VTISRQQRRAAARDGGRRSGQFWSGRPVPLVTGGVALVVALGCLAWLVLGRQPPARDGSPNWSPDGTHIVYYSERDGHGDLFVMRADVRRLTDTAADEGSPAYAPDGRRIAFDSDLSGNFDIYVMAADGSGQVRVTSDPARDVSPAWSPDGTKIVFMSDRISKPEFDVFMMNADGTGVERVSTSGTSWFPQYSPDGSRLAFHVGRDVHVLDLATHRLARLTAEPQDGMYPSWSPDGLRLAFMSARNGPMQLFTMAADGADPRPFLAMPAGSAIDPRWSPAGDRVVFVHVPEVTATSDQGASMERAICVADVPTGTWTRLSR
jgi:Tol biopolymer transport system component